MYVVVRITNYSLERSALIFSSLEAASDHLQKDWEDKYNNWLSNGHYVDWMINGVEIDEEQTYHEDDYAILSDCYGDRIEWFLIEAKASQDEIVRSKTTGIQNYFNSCVDYWMSKGDSIDAAIAKAIWWDCVEVWNADKSWTDEKVVFINQWRKYEPYGPVPEAKRVEEGNA